MTQENPYEGLRLDSAQLREIAVEADADPRSVRRVVAGMPVKGMSGQRIKRALQKFLSSKAEQNEYIITLRLRPDCSELVSINDVKRWVEAIFGGGGMEEVSVIGVAEVQR